MVPREGERVIANLRLRTGEGSEGPSATQASRKAPEADVALKARNVELQK